MIIAKEKLDKMVEKESVSGIVMVGEYSIMPTKNGSKYIGGFLHAKGDVPFRVWSNAMAFDALSDGNSVGMVMEFNGSISKYGGTTQVIVEKVDRLISLEESDYSEADFVELKYNVDDFFEKFKSLVNKNVSEKAYRVFETIINDVEERFKAEYAASSYHDNCYGGLLAHTFKVSKIASIRKLYPNIYRRVSSDLLYLSAAFHDIGKIEEYTSGVVVGEGLRLSHHAFGIMRLCKYQNLIEENLGREFFVDMVSVVEQHHGEFGEPCRTVAAYVVHLFDLLDSKLTILDDALGASDGGQINLFGEKLV